MKMTAGVEQAVFALLLLNRLPKKAMLSGESISQQLHVSPTYLQKLMRKLVRAGLVSSMPGAVEGLGSLYQSNGIFHTMFQLKENTTCLFSDVMEEAESAWQSILKRTTIASLHQALNNTSSKESLTKIDSWLNEKIVL